MMNQMMGQMQQKGQMQRGNPLIEQLMGQMMPKLNMGVGMPQQMGMGGYGQLAKMLPGYGTSPIKQMKTKSNYKQFLQTHSMYGKKMSSPIDTAKLLKF